MCGRPRAEGQHLRVPVPHDPCLLTVPDGANEEAERLRRGLRQTRVLQSVRRHSPEHHSEVSGVAGGELDVREPARPEPAQRVPGLGRCSPTHSLCHRAKAFLSDGREQRLLVSEVAVRRRLRDAGASGRGPEGQSVGALPLDQRERSVQQRAAEIAVMVAGPAPVARPWSAPPSTTRSFDSPILQTRG